MAELCSDETIPSDKKFPCLDYRKYVDSALVHQECVGGYHVQRFDNSELRTVLTLLARPGVV